MSHLLISMNMGGNIHDAVHSLNQLGMASMVLSIHPVGALSSIVVLRVTPEEYEDLKARRIV